MGLIKNQVTYIPDTSITALDYLIGSDGDESGKTKNYLLSDLSTFFSASFVATEHEGYSETGTQVGEDMDVIVGGITGTYPVSLTLDQTAAFNGQAILRAGGAMISLYSNPQTVTINGTGGLVVENQVDVYNGSFSGRFLSTNVTATRSLEIPDASGTIALTSDIVTQTLETVTLAGNTTSNGIIMTSGEGAELSILDDGDANINALIDQGGFRMANTTVTNDKLFHFIMGNGSTNHIISQGTAATSTGFATTLNFPDATQTNSINIPDDSGTVAVITSGLTVGWVLSADTATTASWKAPSGGGGSQTLQDTTTLGAVSTDTITIGGLIIDDSTDVFSISLKPVVAVAGQPYFESNDGYFVFKPSTTATAGRFYIMPDGTPTGTTSKLELFNTDYEADTVNYTGLNIFLNETDNEINFGSNRGGTGTRMKVIIGGDYQGSSLQAASSFIELDTDNTIEIKSADLIYKNSKLGINAVLDVSSEPKVALHVAKSDTAFAWTPGVSTTAIFENTSSNRSVITIAGLAAGDSAIWFADEVSESVGRINYNHTDDSMDIFVNNAKVADFESNGDVGFGIQPVAKLHLYENNAETNSGLLIEQDGTGDSLIQFLLTATERWVMGIDNSDADAFIIGNGSSLGSGNAIKISETTLNVEFFAPVQLKNYTVATLPSGTQGQTAYVTDATAPTYLGALTGGGAVVCSVFYNGSAWVSA